MHLNMKNSLPPFLTLLLLVFSCNLIAQTEDHKELIADTRKAKAAFITKEPGLSQIFATSEGYVIFPNVGKGAYVIGGAAGNGLVYENGYLVGLAKLRRVDVGIQVGGQAYRQVIFFNTEAALKRFKEGNFELAANASAVVLDEGRARSVEFREGVAVVTMPKAGAMVEISVGGQKFEYEDLR